jgi:hypothetical protein
MNDHELRDAYERSLQANEQVTPASQLPLDRLQSLVDQSGTEAERLRSLDVLMSSAEGRREFEVAWAAARAARERDTRSFAQRPAIRWFAAAAMLVIAVGSGAVWMNQRDTEAATERLRGGESPVQLVAPGTDNVPERRVRFTWRSVANAKEYTLVVVDTAGGDVFATNTRDTSVTLPDSLSLRSGAQYLWWVQASMPDGGTLSAVTERFRVR